MPSKRKSETASQKNDTTAKRSTAIVTRSVTRSQPPTAWYPLSVDVTPLPSSRLSARASRWAHLPTELLALIFALVSFRVALHLALVNRRLYELIAKHHTASTSLWHQYPPVAFVVDVHSHKRAKQYKVHVRAESVNIKRSADGLVSWLLSDTDSFTLPRHGAQLATALLSVLRGVAALWLDFPNYFPSPSAANQFYRAVQPSSILYELRHFSRLRCLRVKGVARLSEPTLAAALSSLPMLVQLEYISDKSRAEDSLIAELQRLCARQLLQLTISRIQLHQLVAHLPPVVMPTLQSLAVTTPYDTYSNRSLGAVDRSWVDLFPSLRHLTNREYDFQRQLATEERLHLASYTAHCESMPALLNSRTFRLLCRSYELWGLRMSRVLAHSPNLQQLSLSACTWREQDKPRPHSVFPSAADHPAALSNLTYIDFVNGLVIADLTYLLTASSPPVFAQQLTHIALKVDRLDRAAAAPLLVRLPAMYPALTHAHIGVEGRPHWVLSACEQWTEAIKAVREQLGAVWCDDAADVEAWREDVAWKRANKLLIDDEPHH